MYLFEGLIFFSNKKHAFTVLKMLFDGVKYHIKNKKKIGYKLIKIVIETINCHSCNKVRKILWIDVVFTIFGQLKQNSYFMSVGMSR